MDATEISKAVVEWATETCPDLNSIYDQDVVEILDALPVCYAEMLDEEDAPAKPGLGLAITEFGLEQATVHATSLKLEFLVDDDGAANEKLEGFIAALANALRAEAATGDDPTLGGRVMAAPPFWSASYDPPFAVFDDNVKARRAEFRLVVAELL